MTTIHVEQLLDELAQQRRDRVGMSTTALNMVAFVDDRDLLERMAERIDVLAERNVSRALLLSGDECEHSVRSHCTEIDDTLMTHSEQIKLAVKGLEAPTIHSVVHDLLVPNVRTVLLWGGSHLTDPRFSALASLAETVVLFSSAREIGTDALKEILGLRGSDVEHKIRDLAFLRLFPWQDMIADFFDDAELAAELPHLERVDVVTGSASEAYYLVGWLASRLAWEPCGKNEFCNLDGGTITIDVRQEGMPRRVYGVQLHSPRCSFGAVVHDDADDVICLTVEGEKARPRRCAPLHDVDMVSLVEHAISIPPGDIYAQTLAMVERLLEHELE